MQVSSVLECMWVVRPLTVSVVVLPLVTNQYGTMVVPTCCYKKVGHTGEAAPMDRGPMGRWERVVASPAVG